MGVDEPLNEIELKHGLSQLAGMLRYFYLQLVEQGFTEAQALELVKAKAGD